MKLYMRVMVLFGVTALLVLLANVLFTRLSGATPIMVRVMQSGRPVAPWPVDIARILVQLGAAALGCGVLARQVLTPLLAVQGTVRTLAQGDLSARIASRSPTLVQRPDELGALARDIDGMAERLESSQKAQLQLLQDISHELRSPLARLSVALELARRKTSPEATPSLERIETELEQMNGLIGEILTVARLEATATPQVHESVELVALLSTLVQDANFEARAQSKSVVFESGVSHVELLGDSRLLSRALENIVRNAIRHSPPDAPIHVRLEAGTAFWNIIVRDHGLGVAEENLPHLFAPFWRAEASSEGFGLGLSIAVRAATCHGGTVTARNHPEGGLEVTLRLPHTTA
ncbi:MAG: HAMP domain-containing sensor histidine kinase [Armatimonas sp.]